jgi:hypothetical protein
MGDRQSSMRSLSAEVTVDDEVVTIAGSGRSSIGLASDYDQPHSFQPLAADLTVQTDAGDAGSDTDPKYLAAVMGNVIGDALSKLKPILAGLIGKLSITGARATSYSVAAVRGEVGDGVTDADGAFVAVLGGDSALTGARAAYTVDNENSTPGSGFDYGLDLAGSGAHDGYPAVAYRIAGIRFADGTTQSSAQADGFTPAAFVQPTTATPEAIATALIAAGLMAPS